MKASLKPLLRHLSIAYCLTLAACGGGGGSSAPISFTPSTPNTPTGNTPTETPSANLPSVDISAIAKQDPGSALSADWQKGVFMEIYVRGYKDSDGDGIGDLKGVTQSLDYLKDLGITGIWLMPITKSEDRDHGYAVKDYRDIETDYGKLADLDELLKQAHARGIGIIMDYVMNHSANTNPLFVNSADTTTNTYRNWYVWKDPIPTGWNIYGANPWYSTKNGAYFAGFYSGMPDFNLTNQAVVDYHQSNLRFWLNRGVDGFRFDAVGNLIENNAGAWESQPESVALMGKVQQNIGQYDKRFMVCEAPGNPLLFAASTSCGSAFAFGHNYNLVNAVRGQSNAIQSVANYFNTAPATISTMISNHDSFAGDRLWDQIGGDPNLYRLAAATYLLQPGIPFIYYGEEIGMAGASSLSGDAKLRTPMSWTSNASNAGFSTGAPFRALSANVATQNVAAQASNPDSLLGFYKTLIALRKQRKSLNSGNYQNATVSGNVLSFERQSDAERTLVVLNYNGSASSTIVRSLPANAKLTPLAVGSTALPLATNADGNGVATINLNAKSFAIYQVN
ncbi:alpha-amylase family glycosyl hydrolase [Undibacterium cyanobacteriorum]|uniref:Alpha-amylase family glycosyl hydrolase n=1 Tax=Undibacterium cyanobacteriorum TaxID=3073561 RepID=A0ABY9RF05_9BURK|nr:alpha-amylase family glycosyl hydrolase [Undibacterium sp. 20NA77.5]WMW79516.1 alpha-amylase family glycosyl hydrolase [Undibacterium sp. 20NA77.5]